MVVELLVETFIRFLQPTNMLLIVVGAMLGMFLGAIPGIGGATALALLIPLTFGVDPLTAFMFLAVMWAGTSQGGAIAAILLNVPGKSPNAASILDGYPMTRQGRATEALSVAAIASAIGAIIGLSVLALSIPILTRVILLFGFAEIFWLAFWGLTIIAIVVKGNVILGLISAGIGLMIAFHGTNPITAQTRWTYEITPLIDGFRLVPVLIGLFAVAEMIKLSAEGGTISDHSDVVELAGQRIEGFKAIMRNKFLVLRSSLVGVTIGMIPGVGGTAANFIAYFQAVQTSKDSDNFGNGDVRGLIASESSNDAKDGGAYIPTLAFGVPGSAGMAVLFGAFILHGITPGPQLLDIHLDIVVTILLAALFGNIVTSGMLLIFTTQISLVTRVDIRVIAPIVLSVALLATFAVRGNIFDVYVTILFGIIGFLMMSINMSRVPLILAIVLGPIAERNLFRSMQLSRGELGILWESNISKLFILLIVLSFLLPILMPRIKQRIGWDL